MPSRILYVNQSGVLFATAGAGSPIVLPIQSASCEVTKPIEDVLTLGKFTTVGRVQNSVSTCKADLKIFLANDTGANALTAGIIQTLTGNALAGTQSVIQVGPNGFTMSGILTNLSLEGSNGQFATATLSFAGVGDPSFANAPTTNAAIAEVSTITSVNPVTTANISGASSIGCVNSLKFSLDIPNDTISCLGTSPSGSQAAVTGGYQMVAKPPFKTSISVEGAGTDFTNLDQVYHFGKIGVRLPSAIQTSRSFNQAVGQVGATYSYNSEDVSATFSVIP